MLYSWQCEKCKKVFEVTAKVADRDKTPEVECCGKLSRVPTSPALTNVYGFSANNGYS